MKEVHIKEGPFIKSNNKTSNIMGNLLISLIPIILYAIYKNGFVPFNNGKTDLLGLFYPLIFIVIGTFTSFLTEYLYTIILKKEENKSFKFQLKAKYNFFPGLFLALILPINTPIWILIFGAVIAALIGKVVFGGFGANIFNPALIGRLFVITIFTAVIANNGGYLNSYEVDTISKATPLSNVATIEGIGEYDTLVKPYGNLWNFFFGNIPGSVGETSAFLCIIAYFFLTYKKAIKWRIPLVYIATVFIMTYFIGTLNNVGIWYPTFQILSGGLMFGAIFMATDPVTSPTTSIAQVVYGMFLGILTVALRFLTSYPEGVLTSILIMNLFVIILDKKGAQARFDFKKIVVTILFAMVAILGISLYIAESKNVDKNSDPNFEIISKNAINNKTEYVVTYKGYMSKLKASITIKDNKIVEFTMLEQGDSFYPKVEETDYMKLFINNDALESVDTVSGATVTSNAIKKMAINTMNDYMEN